MEPAIAGDARLWNARAGASRIASHHRVEACDRQLRRQNERGVHRLRLPTHVELENVQPVEWRAISEIVIHGADERGSVVRIVAVVVRNATIDVSRQQSVAHEVNGDDVRVEEELDRPRIWITYQHLRLFQRVDADAVLHRRPKIARGQKIGIVPYAVFWVVGEEKQIARLRRYKRITEVRASRVTGL